jgi:hypothetical protein
VFNLFLETFVAAFVLGSFIAAPLAASALYWKERGW